MILGPSLGVSNVLWVGGESQSSGDAIEGKAERGHRKELGEPGSALGGQALREMEVA